jgi:hypothetical protein
VIAFGRLRVPVAVKELRLEGFQRNRKQARSDVEIGSISGMEKGLRELQSLSNRNSSSQSPVVI